MTCRIYEDFHAILSRTNKNLKKLAQVIEFYKKEL